MNAMLEMLEKRQTIKPSVECMSRLHMRVCHPVLVVVFPPTPHSLPKTLHHILPPLPPRRVPLHLQHALPQHGQRLLLLLGRLLRGARLLQGEAVWCMEWCVYLKEMQFNAWRYACALG